MKRVLLLRLDLLLVPLARLVLIPLTWLPLARLVWPALMLPEEPVSARLAGQEHTPAIRLLRALHAVEEAMPE